jgi:hypothetical protein
MKTVVLDVETIPDECAMARCGYVMDDEFAPWPLHELACASVLTINTRSRDDLDFGLQSFSLGSMPQRAIVASVERIIENADQVLTYNGRGHDIPVLLTRAILAGEDVPTLARLGNTARPGLHRDLHDDLKRSGGIGIKLAHVCAAFAIPVKLNSADRVLNAACDGRWTDIEHYCESDVIATWLAAQMWDSAENPGFGLERWQRLAAWIAGEPRPNRWLELFYQVPQIKSPPQPAIVAF